MSYALKFQSSNDLFKSIITKINVSKSYYTCCCCLRKHVNYKICERYKSSYIPVLQLLLKSRKLPENCQNNNNTNYNTALKKNSYTELMKVSKNNSAEKKVKVTCLSAEDSTEAKKQKKMKNKNQYNSMRSCYPSTLLSSDNVVEFVENLINDNDSKSTVTKKEDNRNHNIENDQDNDNTKLSQESFTSPDSKKAKIMNNENKSQKTYLKALENYALPETYQSSPSDLDALTSLPVTADEEDDFKNEFYDNFERAYLYPKSIMELEVNVLSKEYHFIKLLQSYVDVAVTTNNRSEALNVFQACRHKNLWKSEFTRKHIVQIYNQLLQAYADDWPTVCKIRKWMSYEEIPFSHQTWGILLDALGRNEVRKYLQKKEIEKEILKVLKHLLKRHSLNEMTINEIPTIHALMAVRKIIPFFEIVPVKSSLNSSNVLLKNLNKIESKLQSPAEDILSIETLKKQIIKQLNVEKNFFVNVKTIKLNSFKEPSEEEKNKFNAMNKKWRSELHEKLIETLVKLGEKNTNNTFNLLFYLKSVPTEAIVDIMMQTIQVLVEYSGSYSPSMKVLNVNLGEQIHKRYQILKKVENNVAENTVILSEEYCKWYLDPKGPAKNGRHHWEMLLRTFSLFQPVETKEIKWPKNVKEAVGKCLNDIIIKHTKIDININGHASRVAVFYSLLRNADNVCTEEIKCHPVVSKYFQKYGFDQIKFEATQVPMLCPPKPWKSVTQGGYLITSTDYVRRCREICPKKIEFGDVPRSQLCGTFDALNALQAIPWMINKPILKIVLEIFRNGGSKELDVPVYPPDEPIQINITESMNPQERFEEYVKKKNMHKDKINAYGIWCEALYRLSLANHYQNNIFWLPQNLDFRGRVYPIPPHMNHIGSDLYRSLLMFAKGKPLGRKGFDWLKIHVINLTGRHKKLSNEERLKHANEVLPLILDSAENPLTGKMWWSQSEDRWQVLAACMEIKKAIDSGNPETYVSGFPVHQDGSCNGLQHYAALGRDQVGAVSVNLIPRSHPQDIYNTVALLIEAERVKDAESGNEIARVLEGFVQRKVVKQTIMTTVYGVTSYGAKLQIAGKLRDISGFPEKYVWPASRYLAEKIFLCLQQMFTSAKEIQKWFTQSAELICAKKEYVQWISPMGLPILQPYSKKLSNKRKGMTADYQPNVLKQKNAFPPNFIHSLDSTHMMLTALHCEQENIFFASVHDCFWTHPQSVDQMNRICREQFIALHSQSILGNLSNFFVNSYVFPEKNSNALNHFTNPPKTGEFDINEILNSVYFFS